MTTYIADQAHYTEVLSLVAKAEKSVWIGTADIKDVYIKKGTNSIPFLECIADRLKKKVSVKLIHAKEPGKIFRDDFDRYPVLCTKLERRLCPRVHFKIIILDNKTAYIGSANLTGAGIGMKSPNKRNFETGILTDEAPLVNGAIKQFDSV